MAASKPPLSMFARFGRKIVAVGRNYRAHAKELGNPVPEEPLLFLKPVSSYVEEGGVIEIPKNVQDVHYEVELGVVIDKDGRDIQESAAMDHVGGYVLALDMTARDVQSEAKKRGHPWSVAKGYDTFCPISTFIEKDEIDLMNTNLWLKIDGSEQQNGSTKDMIYSVPYLISYISRIFKLETGDVILTGTPEGVGPVRPGQTINAGITGVTEMSFPVTSRN